MWSDHDTSELSWHLTWHEWIVTWYLRVVMAPHLIVPAPCSCHGTSHSIVVMAPHVVHLVIVMAPFLAFLAPVLHDILKSNLSLPSWVLWSLWCYVSYLRAAYSTSWPGNSWRLRLPCASYDSYHVHHFLWCKKWSLSFSISCPGNSWRLISIPLFF